MGRAIGRNNQASSEWHLEESNNYINLNYPGWHLCDCVNFLQRLLKQSPGGDVVGRGGAVRPSSAHLPPPLRRAAGSAPSTHSASGLHCKKHSGWQITAENKRIGVLMARFLLLLTYEMFCPSGWQKTPTAVSFRGGRQEAEFLVRVHLIN